jgi:hypothetical protein
MRTPSAYSITDKHDAKASSSCVGKADDLAQHTWPWSQHPSLLLRGVRTLRFLQFAFRAQPIVELVPRLTPSFLKQFVGAAGDGFRLDECSFCPLSLMMSRMFCMLVSCCHVILGFVLQPQRLLVFLGHTRVSLDLWPSEFGSVMYRATHCDNDAFVLRNDTDVLPSSAELLVLASSCVVDSCDQEFTARNA